MLEEKTIIETPCLECRKMADCHKICQERLIWACCEAEPNDPELQFYGVDGVIKGEALVEKSKTKILIKALHSGKIAVEDLCKYMDEQAFNRWLTQPSNKFLVENSAYRTILKETGTRLVMTTENKENAFGGEINNNDNKKISR